MIRIYICFILVTTLLMVQANAQTVDILTTEGSIRVELYPDKAPKTVANFLRYVDAQLYANASFYRVVRLDNQRQNQPKIEVIQGGLDADTARLFPPVVLERTSDTGLKHLDGTISMARTKPDNARSEFFICINAQPSLDFGGNRNPDGQGFAAFGRVIAGMEIVKKIQAGSTTLFVSLNLPQRLVAPVKILSIKRVKE